ncbi:MAG: spore cortex biosynthesis protein YabQ [Clostridia bacterium]|nr:spore cortex biosynthesis protein YabQ [Clostridia bacterium]
MEISQRLLLLLLFYSFFWGVASALLYDINRIIRVMCGVKYSKKIYNRLYGIKLPIVKRPVKMGGDRGIIKNAVINVGDFFCVIFAALGIIVLNYSYNNGRFRFFTVIGLCFGFVLYRLTLGKIVIAVAEPIAFLCKYCFLSFFIVFGYPITKIVSFVSKNIKKIVYLCSFTIEKKTKKLYNIEEKVCSLDDGCAEQSLNKKKSRFVKKKRGQENEQE